MLTLSVLGPVQVCRDGAVDRVPGGKTTELLVRLAVEAGTPVRAERLLQDLWSDQGRPAAPNTLQSKVSRLRRALGDPSVLLGDHAGYTLMVEPHDVDAVAVLQIAERAAALLASTAPRAALETCEQGLAMFHGDVLPGAADGRWADPFRGRLVATRLRLVEDRLTAQADLGAAGELVAELEDLTAAYPTRERLWTLLVTTLYRAGRQGDALAACRRVRHLLAEELGIDPGAELQLVEQQVLAHDPRLAVARPAVAPAAPGPRRGNLTSLPTSSLVGRQHEVEQIEARLHEQRLVTLTGPAGVGKTRLAMEVADRSGLPGGGWLARLETATDAASIWRSIGEALGMDAPVPPDILDRLASVDRLLVLDGCEHLVDDVGRVVTSLMSSVSGVRLLATSQVPLRVETESVVELLPLDLADSVTLFLDRATAQRVEAPGDPDTRASVETVCRSLDGLPLAIELAAARTRVLPLREIARRLDDRFALLRDPTSTLPPRHSTLRAAVGWSYDLLSADDQRGLWALAAFTGGAPLPAVEAVLEALHVRPGDGLDIISRLVDRSLVTADVRPRGPARYHLLDSVRAFSRERLREAGLGEVASSAHASWFAGAADRAKDGVRGPHQADHLDLVRTERANIDAALAWCGAHDASQGVRIVLGLGWAWVVLGTGLEGAVRVRNALAAGPVSPEEHAAALTLCGWFEASGGNLDRARTDLRTAIRIGDARARAVARLHLAFVHTQGGTAADALELLEACRGDLRRFDLRWEEGASWLLAAWAHIASGDVPAGQAACDRARVILEPLGDSWATAHAEGLLGELAQAQHRFTDACVHLGVAAEATGRLGFEAAQAHHLLNLGRVQQQAGDPRASRATLTRAIGTGQRCGDLRTVAFARTRLAQVLRDAGEEAAAREEVARAARWFGTAGGGDGALLADYLQAALNADGAEATVRHEFEDVLRRARRAADPVVQVLVLDALAALDSRVGDLSSAQTSLAAADALAAATPTLWPGDRVDAVGVRSTLARARHVPAGLHARR